MKKIVFFSLLFFCAINFASPFEKFYPKIKGHEFTLGDPKAELEIVGYFDLECPFSKRSFPHIQKLLKDYKGKIHFVFKHYPLDFHPHAKLAAQYFEAARIQDDAKAFQFMGKMFDKQKELKKGEKALLEIAKTTKLDLKKLKEDAHSKTIINLVEEDRQDSKASKVTGTPWMYINGTQLSGSFPYTHVKNTIDGIMGE